MLLVFCVKYHKDLPPVITE